jgi:predicted PurR-regulated permease PerM
MPPEMQVSQPTRSDQPEPAFVEVRPPSWRWIFQLLLAIGAAVMGGLVFLAFFRQIRDVLIWAFIALFASFALEPAVGWLAKRGMRRGLATGAILFGLTVIGIVMVALMIPLIIEQLRALIDALPDILRTVSDYTRRWFGLDVSPEALQRQLQGADSRLARFATDIAGNLFGFATSILGTVFKLLTIALFTFYLTADGPRFRRAICSLLPTRQQQNVLWTWEVAIDKTGAYLYSRLLLAVVSGIATYIVLTILGIPFAVPLAIWMGVLSQFIPTIGTYIAMALPLLVAVVESPVDALILLIFFTLYQQLENYLLAPSITAKTMQLHPALAFGCAIAGANISGIVGAFLALPVAAIVQAVASSVIDRHAVVDAELTRDADVAKEAHDQARARGEGRGGISERFRKLTGRRADEPDEPDEP